MKRALLVIVSTLVLAAILVGCGSGQGDNNSGPAASVRVPEALPTAQGTQIVSDAEHLYFNDSVVYGKDGVYSADSNLESATLIFQNYRSEPLCLVEDKLYCNGSTTVESIDLTSHDIVAAAESGSGARSLAPYATDSSGDNLSASSSESASEKSSASSSEGSNADSSEGASENSSVSSSEGPSASLVYVTYNDELLLGSPNADGTLVSKPLDGVSDEPLYALTGDGVVYFSCIDDGYQVFSYDMEHGTVIKIAPIESEWAFTVVGSDVFFLQSTADENSDSAESEGYELMRADAAGNVTSTGVSGKIGGVLYTYGDFVFYTTYIEQTADSEGTDGAKSDEGSENEEPRLIGRPCYYDTVNGSATVIDRDAYDGMDIALRGVAGGYLYFDGHVIDELTGRESFNVYLDKIDGSGEMVNVDLLTKDAKPTDQVLAWNKAAEKRQQEEHEKIRQEIEEEEKNEPYGPGTSKLYLKAEKDRSACYRLYRRDGSIEFQVLLAPGESVTKSFPCGRYMLKIAQGKKWISDEEAFGENGKYDTTDLFNFEKDQAYQIGTGTGSSIRKDSQDGFTR